MYGQNTADSSKYVSYEDQIIIRTNIDTNIENYILSDKAANTKEVLAINSKVKTSLGVDYQFLSASVSFTPSFIPGNNEDNLKGESSYTDIKLQILQGIFFQKLRNKKDRKRAV